MRRGLAVAVAVALAIGACDSAGPAPPAATSTRAETTLGPEGSPSPTPAMKCPNQAAATVAPRAGSGPPLTGDVDGDGAEDRVSLAIDEDGPPGCRSFVVVETAAATVAAPADPGAAETQRGLPSPSLNSLVAIDGDGLEIVVDVEAGASTRFVGIFTMKSGVLARVETRGPRPGYFGGDPATADLFGYGGSVGHIDAVDCLGDASVVVSSAVPADEAGTNYAVERRFFAFEGFFLSLVRPRTERHTIPLEDIERFPEFGRSPFGSCAL